MPSPPGPDIRPAFDQPTLARITALLDRQPGRPADVWRLCCKAVRAVQGSYTSGSLEWNAVGKAYRELLAFDVDGTWAETTAVVDEAPVDEVAGNGLADPFVAERFQRPARRVA